MKLLVAILLGLVALVALGWIAGTMVPRQHVASRSIRLAQPPESVWKVLADFSSYGTWAPEVRSTRRLPDQNGHPVWMMEGKWPMPLEVETIEAPSRLVTRIADPKLPYGGIWTWRLAPENGGTRVELTERGEIKAPIFRLLSRFVFGYTATMDAFLGALAKHFGENVAPGPAVG